MVQQSTVAPEDPRAASDVAAAEPWKLRLLGTVSARRDKVEILRWPSRAAILLLARLAMAPERAHPREELIELLWPGVAAGVGRNRLRQVLSKVRALLEPEGGPAVLHTDRQYIRVTADGLHCDVQRFEQALRQGDRATAVASYGGELLPGFYDEWVLDARRHLAEQFERCERAQRPSLPSVHLLPAPWTRTFGHEATVQRLHADLRAQRLTTIIGAGGSGKTRLAIEAARALQEQVGAARAFERIAFVPLADCRDGADIGQALAHALGVGAAQPLEEACLMLHAGRHLLVLDNAEQIVQPLRSVVTTLLQGVPGLHLLLTSRRRLHLPGEHLFEHAGLPTPALQAPGHALLENPAVALFVDRARAIHPGFAPQEADLVTVGELVSELEGLPLAIELAASRMGSMSPAELLARLRPGAEDPQPGGRAQLELLRHDGDLQSRHASLGAVIAWSWGLLDLPQQRLLAAVSMAAGSADLERLAQVLDEPALRVLRIADELVGHSMLRRQGNAQAPRCALAAALREFVREVWPRVDQQRLRLAWLQALSRWAGELGAAELGARLKPELPSIHLLLTAPDLPREAAAAALDLVLALRAHWESAGMPLKLQGAIETLLSAGTEEIGAARASAAHELLSYLRFEAGFVAEAIAHADAALRMAMDRPQLRASALVRRSWITLARRRTEDSIRLETVRRALQEALALARASGDLATEARALHQCGVLAGQFDRDWNSADAAFAQAQTLWQALGDPRKAMARLRNRAQCWARLGRVDAARESFQQTLATARDGDDPIGCIDSLLSLSTLLADRRDWAAALAADAECVALCWQHRHRHGLAYALWNPALPLAHLRQPEAAMRLMAFAARFWQETFGRLTSADQRAIRRVQALVRRQLGAPHAAACWTEGQALDPAQAVALLDRAVAAACADAS
ncbi:MAG TPA: NACHT domain-containing protein [Rubrivivax sp.]|nr:NACHT domain-containing protein [Rubrivivax sp.]